MSKNKNYKFDSTGLATKEKKIGLSLFKKYQEKYHIENISDLSILNELVFREIIQLRIKSKIEIYKKSITTENNPLISSADMRALDDNLTQIISLKEKLGLLKEKVGDDPFTYIQQLKEKFKIWLSENQATRHIKCPHCSLNILLKIKTEAWEAQKHPFFKDQILWNERLVRLYLEKKITKNDVAEILGTSDFYTDDIVEKFWTKNPQYNEIKKEIEDEKKDKK
jgi:DNA-directed RNA polymerase subunit RPC12/RpoP